MAGLQPVPSAWAQTAPRSVRLAPDATLVPSGTLRAMLRHSRSLDLIYAGYAFEPALPDGATFNVVADRAARSGDLVLCDVDGFGDVRRLLGRDASGAWVTALDALPRARASVSAERVLGVIGRARRIPPRVHAAWARVSACAAWLRRAAESPSFADPGASVKEKYAQQVAQYAAAREGPQGEWLDRLVVDVVPRGAAVLVAGSGAGGEVIRLARAGFAVAGCDFVPAMAEASRAAVREERVEAEIVVADLVALDLRRRFDAVYVTPLVYSFIAGRRGRIAALRNLGRHLAPGGRVVFSAWVARGALERLEVTLAWSRHRRSGRRVELGDWHTCFMTPSGALGKSFIRRFGAGEVQREAREAGFRKVERPAAAYFVARGFYG